MTQTRPLTAARPAWSGPDWAFLGVICFVALAIYFQTRSFGFINYDDHLYVKENRHILGGLSGDSIRWASTAIVAANWHPLTLYTELILSSVFGPGPGTFHLANTFLHVINAGLLYCFLRYATGKSWPAFFAAILWAWHPLRVESVAWISELKDVLCGFFFLGCLIAYVRYCRHRTVWGYLGVVALHAAALMSKPMAVTLPAVLLLLDWWPLSDETDGRPSNGWGMRIFEKLPLFAMSIADITYALSTQRETGSLGQADFFPLVLRLKNAAMSVAFYLRDTVFPARLGLFYPHPVMVGGTVSWAAAISSLLILLAITATVIVLQKQKYLAVGWFWFLGMLTPVIGLVQVGEQARADRYTYLPSIGLTFAVVWLVADLCARRPRIIIPAMVAGTLAALVLAVVAYGDTSYWHDSDTLFTRAGEVIPNNYLAMMIKADILRDEGHADQALPIAAEAARIAPESTGAQITYGHVLQDLNRLDEAALVVQRAINKNTHDALAWDELGDIRDTQANHAADTAVKLSAGDPRGPVLKAAEAEFRAKAIVNYQQSVIANPEYFLGEFHLAYERSLTGHLDLAIAGWEHVLAGYPLFGPAHGYLGEAYSTKGEIDLSVAHNLAMIPLVGGTTNMRFELADRSQQEFQNAIQQYAIAYQLGERNRDWETHLAWLTATNPGCTDAQVRAIIPAAEDAVAATKNQDPLALDALADAYARVGQLDAAITTATTARDVAIAAKKPELAAQITTRIDRYRQGMPYLFGSK